MNSGERVRSGAVVALKPIDQAKSRLGTVPDPLRRQLAWTMAVDTLRALSEVVEEVLVVSPQGSLRTALLRDGLDIGVIPEPRPLGMNGALTYGADVLRSYGCDVVLACVADLPALRAQSVRRVLTAAAEWPRSFLADASGVGTTMLIAQGMQAGGALDPHFQGHSAVAHTASGAVSLTDELLGGAMPDARQDVDTEADLRAATALGPGRATAALLARSSAGAA
ncbi:MAG TPA: 2-phospho-L-lactate guanylyltransferase [Propionibacteriaceae bacterium]|nr:2-phospho-L-lactate guanylyltransferase [Propionibacteriaceae bacterium]